MSPLLHGVVLAAVLLGALVPGAFLWRRIHRDGLLCGTGVLVCCLVVYVAVPTLFLLFPEARDESTLYGLMLQAWDTPGLMLQLLFCAALLPAMTSLYALRSRTLLPHPPRDADWDAVNRRALRWLLPLAHGLLGLGCVGLAVCLHGVGGLVPYLALGSLTRGIGKDVTALLPASCLPFVTLSSVLLAPPFLYRFALRTPDAKPAHRVLFLLSLGLALLYLLSSQGRAPLLLFLLPFLLDWKPIHRLGLGGYGLLFLVCLLSLEGLQRLFGYLAWGTWQSASGSSPLTVLLREFSCPFASFATRHALLREMGLRFGLDLVQWPLVVLPSGFASLVGVDKTTLVTIGERLTDACSAVTGLPTRGGIPADLLFFWYAQGGLLTLLGGLWLLMRLLRACDDRLRLLRENDPARLLVLRAALLSLSCVSNFDIAVLLRTRADLLVLLAVLLSLARAGTTKRG